MSSETTARPGRSLAARLTLWYAGVFAVSSMFALALAYFLIVGVVRERTDDDLSEDVDEFAALLESDGMSGVEQEIRLDSHGDEAEDEYIRLWSRDGTLVAATDLDAFPDLPTPADPLLK